MKYNSMFKGSQGFAAGFSKAVELYNKLPWYKRLFRVPLGFAEVNEPHKDSFVYWNSER